MSGVQRGPDRRRAPRRVEDAILHYSREVLIGAAMNWRDGTRAGEPLDPAAMWALFDAVDNYRQAVAAVAAYLEVEGADK